jgi:DNA-binding transcriptional MerR regulator
MTSDGAVRFFDEPDRPLSTGEFSRRSRLSLKALRLYDRLGLLRPAVVDPGNGYRTYHVSQLFTARLIVTLRRLDMPLPEIADVLAAPGSEALDRVEAYWEQVERRVAVQRQIVAQLRPALSAPGRFAALPIATRDIAEQVLLTEQRHVYLDELPWIRVASARLLDAAGRFGGPTGPRMVIFHGDVTTDSDGPVEVCVPVAAPPGDPHETAWRIEPAHRVACTPVTRAQFEVPTILSIYDAMHQWVDARYVEAGAAREIYQIGIDPDTAAADDVVCEIAIPIEWRAATAPLGPALQRQTRPRSGPGRGRR